jgi:hypothetical protein
LGEEKTIKLNLLFIAMELLTLLAYPIVFVHGKLCRFAKSRETVRVPNLFVVIPLAPGK